MITCILSSADLTVIVGGSTAERLIKIDVCEVIDGPCPCPYLLFLFSLLNISLVVMLTSSSAFATVVNALEINEAPAPNNRSCSGCLLFNRSKLRQISTS
jgi:hypothetical protein